MDDLKTLGIRHFLLQVKDVITGGYGTRRAWVLVKRSENVQCMADLGLNYQSLEELLLSLSVADYCEGPLRDRDVPGELWVFGKAIEGQEVYIKLRLAGSQSSRRVRVISFHGARESLYYPYRTQ